MIKHSILFKNTEFGKKIKNPWNLNFILYHQQIPACLFLYLMSTEFFWHNDVYFDTMVSKISIKHGNKVIDNKPKQIIYIK